MCFYKQSPGKELICVDLHWRCLKLGEVKLTLNIVPLYVWGAQTHLFSVPVFALLNWEYKYKMQLSSLKLLRPLEICGQRQSPRSHRSICRGLTTLEVLLIRSTSKTLTPALVRHLLLGRDLICHPERLKDCTRRWTTFSLLMQRLWLGLKRGGQV